MSRPCGAPGERKEYDSNNQSMKNIKNELLTHLPREMSGYNLNKLGDKGPVKLYGWSLIPNCAKFDIEIKGKDLEWSSVGLEKNITPTIRITPANNRNMNKYMNFQIRRLERCKDKYKF